jgi:hypothetical protein
LVQLLGQFLLLVVAVVQVLQAVFLMTVQVLVVRVAVVLVLLLRQFAQVGFLFLRHKATQVEMVLELKQVAVAVVQRLLVLLEAEQLVVLAVLVMMSAHLFQEAHYLRVVAVVLTAQVHQAQAEVL